MAKLQRNYILYIDGTAVPLVLGTDNQVQRPAVPEIPSVQNVNITIAPPLTLEFDILRNTQNGASPGHLRIYNLGEKTRNAIYKDQNDVGLYRQVRLLAGYGNNMCTVLQGNINYCYSVREGTNFITDIDVLDGGSAFACGNTNKEFPKGTSKATILEWILRDLPKIKFGKIKGISGEIARGNSISGNSAELAQTLSGGGFFIDLEQSYILADGETLDGPIRVITSESGLLGTPKRQLNIVSVDMIFEPGIILGQAVLLNSKSSAAFNGAYKVFSIHHRGMISDAVCGEAITTLELSNGINN